tara:strand:+ start:36 stop:569 length:534 start_codon:yes stop_codon:yes gene_type:complete
MAFTLHLQQLMANDNYLIAIRDNFENILIKSVLKITANKIQKEDIEEHIKKRIFSVIVECVQNICKTEKGVQPEKNSILLLNKTSAGYKVIAGSNINSKRKERLELLMNHLNSKTNLELNTQWTQMLTDKTNLTKQKKEDLALFYLYMKSDRNVKYYIDQDSKGNYFFMIQIEILNN